MKVKINGKLKNIKSDNINQLFDELKKDRMGQLVVLNGIRIIWKDYRKTKISDGDEIEIFPFIGGGQ